MKNNRIISCGLWGRWLPAKWAYFLLLCFIGVESSAIVKVDSVISEVSPGVIYNRIILKKGPVVIHQLRIDLSREDIEITGSVAHGMIGAGLERTSEIVNRENRGKDDVIAAVNADFFGGSPSVFENCMIRDGEFLKGVSMSRTLLMQDVKGGFHLDNYQFTGVALVSKDSLRIQGVNVPLNNENCCFYNSYYRRMPAQKDSVVYWRLKPLGKMMIDSMCRYHVEGRCVNPDSLDFVNWYNYLGVKKSLNEKYNLCDTIAIRLCATPDNITPRFMIGGLPRLIKKGRRIVDFKGREGLSRAGFWKDRHPRTAVGIDTKNNFIYLVVVDGRQPGYSIGMPLVELGEYLKSLGCDEALNFDGGGSSTMVVDQKLMNRPSDKTGERKVGNVLLVKHRATTSHCSAVGRKGTRFAFLTDLHVSQGAKSDSALRDVVKEINNSDFDFAVVTGDLTNRGSDKELVNVKSILDQLSVDCHVIPGNHETNWSESACQTFDKLWGQDRFAFTHDSVLFLGYSTGPYLKMGDGHVKVEDMQWMERTLKNRRKEYRSVVSLNHYPLRDEDLGNASEVNALLNKYPVIASLCGHGHQLRLFNFDSIPGVMGRSLFLRKSKIPGYNIVSLTKDSLFVYEKELGVSIKTPFLATAIGDRSILKDLEISSRQVASINAPKGVGVKCVCCEDASIFTGVALEKSCVYYGTSQGELVAWNYKSNRCVWHKKISKGSVFSTPVVSQGVVVVGSVENKIVAFGSRKGELLWEITTPAPVINTGVIDGAYLYMGGGNYDFMKIHLKTGKILWKHRKVDGFFQAPPVVKAGKVVFGAWDRHLYCLDAKSGDELWNWGNQKPVILFSPGNCVPAISNGKVFFVAPDRYMTALDLESGKLLWRKNAHRVRESMGISDDGLNILAKTMDGQLLSVSATDDSYKELYCNNTPMGYEHNPCPIVESCGVVYMGSRKGLLVTVDLVSGKTLWSYKCGNSSINQISIHGKKKREVWISLIEGKIFRFILPKG